MCQKRWRMCESICNPAIHIMHAKLHISHAYFLCSLDNNIKNLKSLDTLKYCKFVICYKLFYNVYNLVVRLHQPYIVRIWVLLFQCFRIIIVTNIVNLCINILGLIFFLMSIYGSRQTFFLIL